MSRGTENGKRPAMTTSGSLDVSSLRKGAYQTSKNVLPFEVIREVRVFLSEQINVTLTSMKREISCESDARRVQVTFEIATKHCGGGNDR